MLQDAHEFLNYLLNECSELLEKEAKARKAAESPPAAENNADSASQVLKARPAPMPACHKEQFSSVPLSIQNDWATQMQLTLTCGQLKPGSSHALPFNP